MEASNWICKHSLSAEATPNGFWDALEVWLKKPHVVNRRLCGSDILCPPTKLFSPFNITDLTSRLIASWKLSEYDVSHILSEVKAIFGSESSCRVTNDLLVQVRDLMPKQTDKQPTVRELVIFDKKKMAAVFYPLCCFENDKKVTSECEDLVYAISYNASRKKMELHMPYDYGSIANNESETDFFETKPKSAAEITQNTFTHAANEGLDELTLQKSDPSSNAQVVRACSARWLEQVLLVKLSRWASEKNLNTELTSLRLISVSRYNQVYQQLKAKYGSHLLQIWPECTDPQKFVYEDIAIASYLMVLWEQDRVTNNLGDRLQTFVDLGCGNGLLVYILTKEGHVGLGVDVRKRKIWDLYEPEIQLEERTITPSDKSLFPDYDWIIGNHSDELTPWIPVIASRSSYHCKYLVLPCCPWDFAGKFSGHGKLSSNGGSSQYGGYLSFVQEVGEKCGFKVLQDTMRIPSTKRICFIGADRRYSKDKEETFDKKRQEFINRRCEMSSHAVHPTSSEKKHRVDAEEESQHKKCKVENSSAVELDCDDRSVDRDITQRQWTTDFKAREIREKPRNCVCIDKDTVERIITLVFESLLEKDTSLTLTTDEGRAWRKGGSLSLAEVAAKFDKQTLSQLKSECGGLQTLLRNHHNIFHVQGGKVGLRDWSTHDFANYQAQKQKRKGAQHKKMEPASLLKTKLCYFFEKHPDGCPLRNDQCRFAHGESELKHRDKSLFKS